MKETKKVKYRCPYCETDSLFIPGDVLNCPNCGATITPEETNEPKKPVEPEKPVEAPEPQIETPKKRKSIFKRWWFWVLIGFSFIIIAGAVVTGITISYISKEFSNSKTVEVNEWATVDDYQIRVVSVENTKEFGNTEIEKMKTNDNYICLLIEIKNNSNNFQLISGTNFKLKNEKESYDISINASEKYSKYKGDYKAFDVVGSVEGGSSSKYYLVFEAADSTTSSTYKLEYKSGFKKIIVKL